MKHAVLENQLFFFLLLMVPVLLLLRRVVRRDSGALTFLFLVPGLASVLVFIALSVLNVERPGFLWHDEPNILSVAAAYLHGEPLYHGRDAADLYSLLYGPWTYLLYVPMLKFFKEPSLAIRIAGLAVDLLNLALLYRILRLRVSRATAMSLLPVPIGYLLLTTSHIFGVRGDPGLLACFCVGLLCVERLAMLPAAFACGIACGAAVDFKATAVPVACLLIAILHRRFGWRASLLSGAVMLIVAALPFALPGVSFANYAMWLGLSGRQGFLGDAFGSSVMAAAFLLAPGVLLRFWAFPFPLPARKRSSGVVTQIMFLAALCGCVLSGSKNGAGAWHLWPMLPFVMLWTATAAARRRFDSVEGDHSSGVAANEMLGAISLAAFAVCLRWGYRDFRIVHPPDLALQRERETSRTAELRNLETQYDRRNLAMGYGRDAGDPRSSERFELALAGEDYFLDESALDESIKARVAMPPALVLRILGCHDVWLIPQGERPFATLSTGVLPGDMGRFLFPDAVRLHFTDAHLRIATGTNYDVWACPVVPEWSTNEQ